MTIGLGEGTVKEICREGLKVRKAEYLKDLDELGELVGMAAEYVSQALAVCVRKTHVLGAQGIKDLLDISEKLNLYANAADVLGDRSGKARRRYDRENPRNGNDRRM